MAENIIYIKIYNTETMQDEWREFYTREIEELIEQEIIDTDLLGWAMMKDKKSFDRAFEELEQAGGQFGYKEIADKYIELSGEEIRIEL